MSKHTFRIINAVVRTPALIWLTTLDHMLSGHEICHNITMLTI